VQRRVLSLLGFTLIPALISSVTVLGSGSSAGRGAAAAAPAAPAAEAVARGAYLVRFGSCHDCHTPFKMGPKGPEPDMSRALSGHPSALGVPAAPPKLQAPWVWAGTGTNTAFAGPWGISFTANLTPDKETGLGNWTEEQFIMALRTGRHEGKGRPILPPMPYPFVGSLNDDDLKAVFAYLRSIPAIPNRVPAPVDPVEEESTR
jgi:mono/diheme cytochrome c family protein